MIFMADAWYAVVHFFIKTPRGYFQRKNMTFTVNAWYAVVHFLSRLLADIFKESI
jgi:hypothetical protein